MTNLKAYFIACHRSQWTLLARSKNLPLPSVVPVRQPSHQCYDPFPNLLFYFNAPETQSVSRAHSDSWPNAVAMRIWRWSNRRSENMLGQINLLLLSFACYVADCKFYFAFVAFLIKKGAHYGHINRLSLVRHLIYLPLGWFWCQVCFARRIRRKCFTRTTIHIKCTKALNVWQIIIYIQNSDIISHIIIIVLCLLYSLTPSVHTYTDSEWSRSQRYITQTRYDDVGCELYYFVPGRSAYDGS